MHKPIHITISLPIPTVSGPHIPPPQVQHQLCDQDCCGAGQPVRAAQDVGWSEEDQQELSPHHHQGHSASSQCQLLACGLFQIIYCK